MAVGASRAPEEQHRRLRGGGSAVIRRTEAGRRCVHSVRGVAAALPLLQVRSVFVKKQRAGPCAARGGRSFGIPSSRHSDPRRDSDQACRSIAAFARIGGEGQLHGPWHTRGELTRKAGVVSTETGHVVLGSAILHKLGGQAPARTRLVVWRARRQALVAWRSALPALRLSER